LSEDSIKWVRSGRLGDIKFLNAALESAKLAQIAFEEADVANKGIGLLAKAQGYMAALKQLTSVRESLAYPLSTSVSSLVGGLLNDSAYFLSHSNLSDILDKYGVGAYIQSYRTDLSILETERVATFNRTSEGAHASFFSSQSSRLGRGVLDSLAESEDGVQFDGFLAWLDAVTSAFYDQGDYQRPIYNHDEKLSAFLATVTAEDPKELENEFLKLKEAFSRSIVGNRSDLNSSDTKEGISVFEDSYERSRKLLRELGNSFSVTHLRAQLSTEAWRTSPDFTRVSTGDLLPLLGDSLIRLKSLTQNAEESPSDSNLASIIEAASRRVRDILDSIRGGLQRLANLLVSTAASRLWVPLDTGGVSSLISRINDATASRRDLQVVLTTGGHPTYSIYDNIPYEDAVTAESEYPGFTFKRVDNLLIAGVVIVFRAGNLHDIFENMFKPASLDIAESEGGPSVFTDEEFRSDIKTSGFNSAINEPNVRWEDSVSSPLDVTDLSRKLDDLLPMVKSLPNVSQALLSTSGRYVHNYVQSTLDVDAGRILFTEYGKFPEHYVKCGDTVNDTSGYVSLNSYKALSLSSLPITLDIVGVDHNQGIQLTKEFPSSYVLSPVGMPVRSVGNRTSLPLNKFKLEESYVSPYLDPSLNPNGFSIELTLLAGGTCFLSNNLDGKLSGVSGSIIGEPFSSSIKEHIFIDLKLEFISGRVGFFRSYIESIALVGSEYIYSISPSVPFLPLIRSDVVNVELRFGISPVSLVKTVLPVSGSTFEVLSSFKRSSLLSEYRPHHESLVIASSGVILGWDSVGSVLTSTTRIKRGSSYNCAELSYSVEDKTSIRTLHTCGGISMTVQGNLPRTCTELLPVESLATALEFDDTVWCEVKNVNSTDLVDKYQQRSTSARGLQLSNDFKLLTAWAGSTVKIGLGLNGSFSEFKLKVHHTDWLRVESGSIVYAVNEILSSIKMLNGIVSPTSFASTLTTPLVLICKVTGEVYVTYCPWIYTKGTAATNWSKDDEFFTASPTIISAREGLVPSGTVTGSYSSGAILGNSTTVKMPLLSTSVTSGLAIEFTFTEIVSWCKLVNGFYTLWVIGSHSVFLSSSLSGLALHVVDENNTILVSLPYKSSEGVRTCISVVNYVNVGITLKILRTDSQLSSEFIEVSSITKSISTLKRFHPLMQFNGDLRIGRQVDNYTSNLTSTFYTTCDVVENGAISTVTMYHGTPPLTFISVTANPES